ALFVTGLAGDANPNPRGTYKIAYEHGDALAKEVDRLLTTKLVPINGPLKTAFGEAALPLAPPPSPAELERLVATKGNSPRKSMAEQILLMQKRGEKIPTEYKCPIEVWQFGSDLTFVALSGEVVSDYIRLLEDALGPTRLWLSAYSNDVYGYLPSARTLREG